MIKLRVPVTNDAYYQSNLGTASDAEQSAYLRGVISFLLKTKAELKNRPELKGSTDLVSINDAVMNKLTAIDSEITTDDGEEADVVDDYFTDSYINNGQEVIDHESPSDPSVKDKVSDDGALWTYNEDCNDADQTTPEELASHVQSAIDYLDDSFAEKMKH